MKTVMRRLLFSVLLVLTPHLHAFGQDFSVDPQDAIAQSVGLAQETLSNPLMLEGLQTVVSRYNRARVELSPAGYESEEWLAVQLRVIFDEVNRKTSFLDEVTPLPEEDVIEMLVAFSNNREAFYSFYSDIQGDFGFEKISPDQMLLYLSTYAVVANTADSGLWDALSAFTGVWPLCFWQG